MQRFVIAATAALALAFGPAAAMAQVKTLAAGKAWSAYSMPDKSGPICYLVGKPVKSTPANATRGSVDAMISHRVGEQAWYVVTFNLGYAAKPDAKAELAIDGKKFALFIDKDAAWAPDSTSDKIIALALSRGKTATLKAVSARGTATTDTYNLAGFGDALKTIDTACKAPR